MRILKSAVMWIVLASFSTQPALATVEEANTAPPEASVPAGSLTVPAGTRVSMTLSTQLTAKDTRPGTPVRAVTAFPVAAGSQVAIPAGTFVEGTVVSVKKRSSSGPRVQIHFTNLLFGNGYSVPLDATNLQAEVIGPEPESPSAALHPADGDAPLYAANIAPSPAQTEPPPLHNPGPNIGVIAGATLGLTAGAFVIAVLVHRREGSYGPVLFDTGWQFEMVLQSPLTLDASSVAPAVAAPAAQ